ncbi:MAG TPA: response regulator transcription factor [Bryobacteraceae bacterium]|nr:response regulator transcription factor [Bryobacteraceae bacterium]
MGHPVEKAVVVSRHAVLVAGFRGLIAEPRGIPVAECADLGSLAAAVMEHRPGVVLVDSAALPDIGAVREWKMRVPHPRIILWVDRIAPEFVREAPQCGVRGILRKDAAPAAYAECLERVAAGQFWLERDLADALLTARSVRLSPRERQLIGLLTQGLRNKEIAGRMNITEGTAKAYLSRLFEKTGAGDRLELAVYAMKNLETRSKFA